MSRLSGAGLPSVDHQRRAREEKGMRVTVASFVDIDLPAELGHHDGGEASHQPCAHHRDPLPVLFHRRSRRPSGRRVAKRRAKRRARSAIGNARKKTSFPLGLCRSDTRRQTGQRKHSGRHRDRKGAKTVPEQTKTRFERLATILPAGTCARVSSAGYDRRVLRNASLLGAGHQRPLRRL